jgi:hypothetical protein
MGRLGQKRIVERNDFLTVSAIYEHLIGT